MLKVFGIVSFRVFPTHMGGQKGVALFYKYLQQHAAILLAVSADNIESKEVILAKFLYPNKKIYQNIFKLKKLKKLVQNFQPDVIIAEHSYTGWIAWLLKRSTGKPFIIHSHNIESKRFHQMNKWWWKVYQLYEGWIHKKADHNFFISREDKDFAIKIFHLTEAKCSVITFGVEEKIIQKNKAEIKRYLGLNETKVIFLFNGTLDYEPNSVAVINLIDNIIPLLNQKINNYQVIITGNRASKKLIEKMLGCKNVTYTGYVDDVDLYYQCADLFLNPVSNDTGVKTKLIEAIANNCSAISTESGASGIMKDICGDKLITVADNDWNTFGRKIIETCSQPLTDTPQTFYEQYGWETIITKAIENMKNVIENKRKYYF